MSKRYYIETQEDCELCSGQGVLRSRPAERCEVCEGNGYIAGKQEVGIVTTTEGEGFVILNEKKAG